MKHQNLIIYQFPILYQILKELEEDINFNISEAKSQDSLRKQKMNLKQFASQFIFLIGYHSSYLKFLKKLK